MSSKSKPVPEQAAASTLEVIARFQLQTETLLAEHRNETARELGRLQRSQGQLETSVTELRQNYREILLGFEQAQRVVRQAEAECNLALRQAVAQAEKAAMSAAVYERLRDAQPDFIGMIKAAQRKLGEGDDKLRVIQERLEVLTGLVDATASRLVTVQAGTDSNSRALSSPHIGRLVQVP